MGDEATKSSRWTVPAGLALLVTLSLAGDIAAAFFGIGVPGAIIGLGAYLALLAVWPAFGRWTLPAARLLTRYLGALIVPAAVGLAAFAPSIADAAPALALVLVVSTLVTGLTTALLYAGFKR